ncbi:BRO-N domain-containing protein [Clostridium grantii]|uniref:Prophage antirepressor n=1 Tax=Clostridium grantii DSM 8605 TaxID=1121316 RepID=A0A1M5REU6_9CLOT|nr:BRO family protein [Clostridium grantii]SHH24630.1 Prophage antirepressor [Clostridium grantii DSM 8605]
MNKDLKIFNNEEFGSVRWVKYNNKDYAVANDIASSLGYSSPKDAVSRHCKGGVETSLPSNGGMQIMKIIPEGDIYRLVIKSKLPDAEKFESWIFDEVLPSIRKTGGYVNNEELFIETYLPYTDENTKLVFKNTLSMVRKQNEIIGIQNSTINKQGKEIEHKEGIIIGLVDEISLAEKRQVLNRVVRYKGANFQLRWRELYKQFSMKYHINLEDRVTKYNKNHKPKLKSKIDYIDKVMNKIPELYEIACKLYESDVKELAKNLYNLNETSYKEVACTK